MNKFTIIALSASLMVAGPVSVLEAAPLFRVTNLGTLGGDTSGGSSVNNSAEVVGGVNIVAGGQGYAAFHDGNSWHFLGTQADALDKVPYRMNYHGDVIGVTSPEEEPYIFTAGVYYGFVPEVFLYDLNDNLVYVGSLSNRAFIGSFGGNTFIVPGAGQPPYQWGMAYAINNAGQVVGQFGGALGFTNSAFYYEPGGGDPILLTPPAGYEVMEATAINELGGFAGNLYNGGNHAFICNGVNSNATILPNIGGWTYMRATDISDDGTVIGVAGYGTGIQSPFLYQAGQTYFLSSVVNGTGRGWFFDGVTGISPNGKYVTGYGRFEGQYRAFLLTAINPGEYVIITKASKSGSSFTLEFASDPGLSGWQIKASTNLTSFPINKTADSVITEIYPGVFRAVVNVAGAPSTYFLRVERP